MKKRFLNKRMFIGLIIGGILFIFVSAWFSYTSDFSTSLRTFFIRPKPYNVIMISIDTLRADHMGAYGYSRDTSPNLDRFAEENILFEQAIVQAPFTLASHASVFTSQYASVHGLTSTRGTLSEDKTTLAEILKENGYKSAAFVDGRPFRSEPRKEIFKGFDMVDDQFKTLGRSVEEAISKAVEWIKGNKDDRFFLFLHAYDIHAPFYAPEPFEHMFDPEYDGVLSDHERFYLDFSDAPPKRKHPNAILPFIRNIDYAPAIVLEDETIPLTQRDIDHIVAHYDEGIAYTDFFLQQFFDSLKELDVYDNSIIVLFGDHGENLADRPEIYGENRLIGHGTLYDEVMHVPLIIRYPDVKPKRVGVQAQLIDVFPTILNILHILPTKEQEARFQGKSLVSAIEGRAREDFNEYVYGEAQARQEVVFVRSLQWKLISRSRERFELYNLQHDPKETRDLIDQQPHIAEQLKEKLLQWELGNIKKKLGMD